MGLNIKNERVHDLVRQAARVTGLSQTGVIEEAVERLLAEHGVDSAEQSREARLDLVRDIVVRYREAPGGDRSLSGVDELYDDATGLPR